MTETLSLDCLELLTAFEDDLKAERGVALDFDADEDLDEEF